MQSIGCFYKNFKTLDFKIAFQQLQYIETFLTKENKNLLDFTISFVPFAKTILSFPLVTQSYTPRHKLTVSVPKPINRNEWRKMCAFKWNLNTNTSHCSIKHIGLNLYELTFDLSERKATEHWWQESMSEQISLILT